MQTYALVPNMKPCQTPSLISKAENLSEEEEKNKTTFFPVTWSEPSLLHPQIISSSSPDIAPFMAVKSP